MAYLCTRKISSVPSLGNRHQHWTKTANERKLWHALVLGAFCNYRPPYPLKLASVEVVRFSSRRPDFDNLVYSFKPVFDGLIHARIIVDDDMLTIVDRKYRWEKCPEKDAHIVISVKEILEHDRK